MNDRALLMKEIEGLPDFLVAQILNIVRYVKMGIDHEYLPETDNVFYGSDEFKDIVAESISEYRQGKTEEVIL